MRKAKLRQALIDQLRVFCSNWTTHDNKRTTRASQCGAIPNSIGHDSGGSISFLSARNLTSGQREWSRPWPDAGRRQHLMATILRCFPNYKRGVTTEFQNTAVVCSNHMLYICVYLWRAKYCCRPRCTLRQSFTGRNVLRLPINALQRTPYPHRRDPKDSHPSHHHSHERKTRSLDGRPHFSRFVAGCCEPRLERLNREDGELGANILLGFNGCLDLATTKNMVIDVRRELCYWSPDHR
jgi:hypothetical protein